MKQQPRTRVLLTHTKHTLSVYLVIKKETNDINISLTHTVKAIVS